MDWASSLSERMPHGEALAECHDAIAKQLGTGVEPDLVVVFASPHHRELEAAALRERFPDAVITGCTGHGVIGAGHEVEAAPALSITAAKLPGVSVHGFHLTNEAMPTPDAAPEAWANTLGVGSDSDSHFILLADPFSMDGDALLSGLDFAFPAAAKIGGLASGGNMPGAHALYLNGQRHASGVVGVALSGNIIVDTVVAQGCRPIGEPMRVTQAERNLLIEADGASPIQTLQALFERMSARVQALVQRNLFLGVSMDPLIEEVQAGDFLIRNIIGVDQQRGAVAVGALLREGQIVQFHVRDAETSAEDLRGSLGSYLNVSGGHHATAALMFQCTGRGQGLYGQPSHDSGVFNELFGELPLGGFFCNGEIGPVAGATYLHGYTSSFAIFRERTAPDRGRTP